ncbi:MAG: DUF2066 domain-containing protein [Pseudomonadota bacterium]
MIRRLLLACILTAVSGLGALGAAHADTRAVYTITDIAVDQRAASVLEAVELAQADARRIGAAQLIDKLTLPEDLAAAGGLIIDQALADRLVAAIDVQEESRGGGRYRGVLSAVFNPVAVRQVLDQRAIPYLDRQAPRALIVPIGDGRSDLAWQAAWPERDEGELAPYVTSTLPPPGPAATWAELSTEARVRGAQRGVIAELIGQPGAYAVDLTLVTAAGQTRLGRSNYAGDLPGAAAEAATLLSDIWKASAIVRTTTRTVVTASVFYTSIAEWNTLRSALARSPLVSQFTTDAIARDGALVRFSYAGETERLMLDLRQRGVELDADASGWVLTSAVSAIP